MSAQADTPYSVNERAERLMGRRLSPEDEARGIVAIDLPCELGYECPVHKGAWNERLQWSEYAGFLWCPDCNRDYPSALCVRIDKKPDPKRDWVNRGPDAAIRVFLDSVEEAARRVASGGGSGTTKET